MADVELLTIGPPHTLVQNLTYALPARSVDVFVLGSGMEVSNDNSTWQAITLDSNKEFQAFAQFIRSTAVGSIITLKAR